MSRNPVYEWQRVQLQRAMDDNHVQLHVPDKNAEPEYASLFDMALALTIGFSLFELAVELLRIERLNAPWLSLLRRRYGPRSPVARRFLSAASFFNSMFSSEEDSLQASSCWSRTSRLHR
jgi:hypothetical protein